MRQILSQHGCKQRWEAFLNAARMSCKLREAAPVSKFCTQSVLYILPVPVALCHRMLRMHNRPLKAFWVPLDAVDCRAAVVLHCLALIASCACAESVIYPNIYRWPATQLPQKASCHGGRLCNHAPDLLQQALLNVCVVDVAELSHIHSQLPLLLLREHPLIMRAPCMSASSHRSVLPHDGHWCVRHCPDCQHMHHKQRMYLE